MYFGPRILEGQTKVATLNQFSRAKEPQSSFVASLNAYLIFNVNSSSNGASSNKVEQKSQQHGLQPHLKPVGFTMMLYLTVCAGLEEHIMYLLKD